MQAQQLIKGFVATFPEYGNTEKRQTLVLFIDRNVSLLFSILYNIPLKTEF